MAPPSASTSPLLEGVTILNLGAVGPAARAARMLADYGARVVMIAPVSKKGGLQTKPVYHTYGMTETATHVALRRMNGPDATGRFAPLPGVAIGADARGCLHVTGPMTGGAMIQTNDLVEIHRDGSFAWLGRWDNVINSGGVKVQVEQVEAAAAQVAADQPELGLARRRFFVAGLPDERLGQEVVMLVEGPAGDQFQCLQEAFHIACHLFQNLVGLVGMADLNDLYFVELM